MNEDMIARWNNVVGPYDEVYCLGDFSLAFRSIELYSFRLNGIKHLVPGNHDMCHSYHKRSRKQDDRDKWIQKYKDYGWNVLPEQTTLDIPGLATFNLCHHPYSDDNSNDSDAGYQDKYAKWRPLDDGRVLLHGHVHEKFLTKKSSKGTLMINVGVDVHDFYPISIDRLAEIIKDHAGDKC
jgi:calcineurin-like phosphoesterase family protein